MCSGQEAGSEAAIHAVREVFENEETEAALLVDAANAFNNINRQALLHNIKIIYPIISQYVINCYKISARLFIIGGKKISSREGTTQRIPCNGNICYWSNTTDRHDVECFNECR